MATFLGKPIAGVFHTKVGGVSPILDNAGTLNRSVITWQPSSANKGTITLTQPITENPRSNLGKAAKSFYDDFYNHILVEPSTIDVGSLASNQIHKIKIFNGYLTQKTLLSISQSSAEGINLTSLPLPLIFGALGSGEVSLNVTTEGPSTIGAGFGFSWSTPADDTTINVKGIRLVSLPFQAEAPWSETLEWMTTVITVNNGFEQRQRQRLAPRQRFSGTYTVPPAELARAYTLTQGWKHRIWGIPVWSEVQRPGPLTSGQVEIVCETGVCDFRVGGLVAIWEGINKIEILEILAINVASITLKVGMVESYVAPVICPVRTAYVEGNISRKASGSYSVLNIDFLVKDNLEVTSVAPQQYKLNDIYFDNTLLQGSYVNDSVITRDDVVDYSSGLIARSMPWTQAKQSRTIRLRKQGLANTWQLRKFLHRRSGKLKPFWTPTFEDNMKVVSVGPIVGSIDVTSLDYVTLVPYRKDIAIQLTDDSWVVREIVATEQLLGGALRVGLDTPLGLDASAISKISFLTLNRLDTDRVEIHWPGNAIAECTLPILEIIG